MKRIPSLLPQKKPKRFWLLLTLAAVAMVLLLVFLLRVFGKETPADNMQTAMVAQGNIVRTIEGSGVIEAGEQYTIRSLVTGEVLSDTFSEGDIVEKDALLYVIDSTTMDYNIEKAKSGVASARLAYDEALETQANLQVTAPIAGVITDLSVHNGETLSAGKSVGTVTNASRMLLTLPFLKTDAQGISPGDVATVIPESAPSQTISGTVKSISTGTFTSSIGALVSSVEIWVENPGALLADTMASATVGSYACHAPGSFSYEATESILLKAGGIVRNLAVQMGDRVEKGQLLFTLESDSTARSTERSRLSYSDSLRSLENTYDQLEDYQIKAPISGTVIQKSVKAGDKLENGSGSNASSMAVIADLSTLTFEMAVDELDIADIAAGQEVRITADAVPGKTFTGYVETVSIMGTTANGVTTYPVTVVLDGKENAALLPGMNVSATIVIAEKTNILVIPTAAVRRGNMVLVKGEGRKDQTEASQLEAPKGYCYVRIETGITDGQHIEVLSGLLEGDELLVPASVGSENSAMQFTPDATGMQMGGMSGMHGMMGGMPAGGMGSRPSGR